MLRPAMRTERMNEKKVPKRCACGLDRSRWNEVKSAWVEPDGHVSVLRRTGRGKLRSRPAQVVAARRAPSPRIRAAARADESHEALLGVLVFVGDAPLPSLRRATCPTGLRSFHRRVVVESFVRQLQTKPLERALHSQRRAGKGITADSLEALTEQLEAEIGASWR